MYDFLYTFEVQFLGNLINVLQNVHNNLFYILKEDSFEVMCRKLTRNYFELKENFLLDEVIYFQLLLVL